MSRTKIHTLSLLCCAILLTACGSGGSNSETQSDSVLSGIEFPIEKKSSPEGPIRITESGNTFNKEAVIPPQCYTKHENNFNPCMTCHQTYEFNSRPNSMNDGGLQAEYAFSDVGVTNHWQNLFENRQERISGISDQEVIDYIYTENYSTLIKQLKEMPDWEGPIPEVTNYGFGAEAFDENGFAKDGSHWVAFNYKPLPSTFWATNGSTDDVLIRLPEKFRTSACSANEYSAETYMANLSILEATIKDIDSISVSPIDENKVCSDLNGDGQFSVVNQIKRPDNYVGAASDVAVHKMLYPEGVQFLHSVRYVGVDANGEIFNAPRMKELRFMEKFKFFDENNLDSKYINERQEKLDELIPKYTHRGDKGTDNSFGWMVQGFIEGENGHLRRQTQEEHLFCMGCHTTIGSTIDQTFSFARKITGTDGWGYIDLKGMKDAPNVGNDNEGEIAHYLRTVGGGNEFRENDEIKDKFFNSDGTVNTGKVSNADVYELTTPSIRRALDLNKAYMTIVKDQDFIHGRDANLKPVQNVYSNIDEDAPILPTDKTQKWDLRLNWKP